MISAKQAIIISSKAADVGHGRIMKNIEFDIKTAAQKGERSICYGGSLNHKVRERLELLGYKVECGSKYNEPYYSVSW